MNEKAVTARNSEFFGRPYTSFLRVAPELFWVATGQLVAALGSLALVRLLTGQLSPASYGEFALGLTVATLFQQIVFGPLTNVAVRFFAPAREAQQLRTFTRALNRLLIDGTLILGGFTILLSIVLALTNRATFIPICLGAICFSLVSGWGTVVDAKQSAARHRSIVAWHQGMGQWARTLTAFAAVAFWSASGSAAMVGYAIGALPALISQTVLIRRKTNPLLECEQIPSSSDLQSEILRLKRYALPISLWGIFTWAQQVSDRWALEWFSSTNEVGLYQTLYQTGYAPLSLLTNVGLQLTSPILFSVAGDGHDSSRMERMRKISHKLTAITLAVTGLATLTTFGSHNWIYRLLTAPEYWHVSPLLPWIVLSAGVFAAGQVASLSIVGSDSTTPLLIPKIVTAILGIILNFFGARSLGITGVIMGGLAFSLIYLVWVSVTIRTKTLDQQ